MTAHIAPSASLDWLTPLPIIDKVRTLVQDEGLIKKLQVVHEISGVATATLDNWFNGTTRKPQHVTIARSRLPAQACRSVPQCGLGVDGAVELGMKTADRFDLCGQDLLAQKTALLRQRNPEFPDVAQSLATYRINGDP